MQAVDCVPVCAQNTRPSYRRGCKATPLSERREAQGDATSVSCKTVTCKWLTTCFAAGRPARADTSAPSSPPLGLPPPPPEALRCCCLFRCCWPRPPRLGGTWRRPGGLSDGRPAGTAAAHYPAKASRRAPPERLRRGRQPGGEKAAAFGASINPGALRLLRRGLARAVRKSDAAFAASPRSAPAPRTRRLRA